MNTVDWGDGRRVSQLCLGALPMGPNQKGLTPKEGGAVIRHALEKGVNFIDTAQSYRTYDHIREGLKGWTEPVYIATKSSAVTYEDMEEAVAEAREKLERDSLDIFHLHAARTDENVFEKRAGALECLREMKAAGKVGLVGLATHSVRAVRAAALKDDIDVVFPLINLDGLGILHGNRAAMEMAISEASRAGKLIYAMKAFAGGNLLDQRREALEYVLSVQGVDVVAVGMVSADEVEVNVSLFSEEEVDPDLWERTSGSQKRLIILGFCEGCGSCIEYCPNEALSLSEEICQVDRDSCILCGYCAPACPMFAIRLV